MPHEWTSDRISTLIALWHEGHSTSIIGTRLGITKNAVVGKVHRLGLPKRGSPIKQKAKKPADIINLAQLRSNMCVWPFGEPGEPDFRFCGNDIVQDKPYCEEHCRAAYVRPTKESKGKQLVRRRAAVA